jgi:TolA-binding protein
VLAASLLLAGPRATRAQAAPSSAAPVRVASASAGDTALVPDLDAARAADAQIRIAAFNLLNGDPVAALARLRTVTTPAASSAPSPWRGEPDRQFLLAESFYRLGMDDSMRVAAEAVLAGPAAARYGAALRTQLLFTAYRSGDLTRGLSVIKDASHDQQTALSEMVTGLVDYQGGDLPAARAAFALAQQLGGTGPYADYARYMGAIAAVRADSTHASASIAAVDAAIAAATGEGADQLRLASAELATNAKQYDQAAAAAGQVDPHSGSDAAARTVRAWALARSDHPDLAAQAFADIADRYPQLPRRDENRLMAAQALLAQDRAGDAEGNFVMAGDSASTAVRRITQWEAAPHPLARALVATRSAGLLLMPDVWAGKTFVFPDSAGAQADVIHAVLATSAAPTPPAFVSPSILSVANLVARVDSAASRAPEGGLTLADRDLLRRAVFTPEPAGADGVASRTQLVHAVRALHDADVAVAEGNAAVADRRSNLALQLKLLARERAIIAAAGDSLGPMLGRLSIHEDSLAHVTQIVDEAGVRLRRLFAPQLEGTRRLAADNVRLLDSVRQVVRIAGTPADLETLDREAATAAEYSRVADVIERGLPGAIASHPAFALRDTVRLRGERTRQLIVQAQRAVTTGEAAVDDQIARVSQGDTAREARQALAVATALQDQAAASLTVAVEHDLGARGAVLADEARRDAEAAEFGAAAAAFFKQIAFDATSASAGSARQADRPPADTIIGMFERLVQRYPNSPARPGALYELGELLVRRADERFAAGQRAAATDTSRAGRAEAPAHPDYSAAIARYEELVQRYPTFPQLDGAAYTLGTLYGASERYADAGTMFERVANTEDSPLRAESWFRLGDARFEMASAARGAQRQALFGKAATAYEQAAAIAPTTGDVYYLALYKLGWAYYSQASQQNQDGYRKAVDVFGRLVEAYDKLPADRQARLGLRDETMDYMAVSFTQVGGADAMNHYFTGRVDTGYKAQVLRRVASRLRDQGDFSRAVDAYRELLVEAPNDSIALSVSRDVIDIYQNRTLEPDKAQGARLALVDKFAPGFSWTGANPGLSKEAGLSREVALREAAQYELAKAEGSSKAGAASRGRGPRAVGGGVTPTVVTATQRQHFAEAARLYGKYMADYGASDSARSVDDYYAEALFGNGQYAQAGAEYARAAYGFPADTNKTVIAAQQRAAQNAIVAFDSALGSNKADHALQDSLFSAVNRYAARYPRTEVAKHALIEEGRRASEASRWDVMAAAFRQYATQYPQDTYTPTAVKLVGDALYKAGKYADAQTQWDSASVMAQRTGHQTFADSVKRIQAAAASTYADSLVKAGQYQKAAEDVYVAYADANPTTEKAADALRDAIETYMLADSVARAHNDDTGSKDDRGHAAELSKRLITEYPLYRYRLQYQTLYSDLLAEIGKGDESIDALRKMIADNPEWHGRADAEIRLAVRLDSLHRQKEAGAAYEQFAADYPKDKRAADALYNAAVTDLQANDTTTAARVYGAFARRFPTDTRATAARALRVALLKATGDTASVNADLAAVCTVTPAAEFKADCATRAGRAAFAEGVAQFQRYRPMHLVISRASQLTALGVKRAAAPKLELLTALTKTFTRAIQAGDPEYLAAATYYIGVAQWEYGNFLKNVELPSSLSDAERTAATQGAAGQATAYYTQAQKTWQALIDKAAQQKIANKWIDMARDAVQGKVPDDL